jgi:predicted nucleic acid-binding protein
VTGFLDTNILVYAFIDDHRAGVAHGLMDGDNRIAVQSLNEFALVARRRLAMPWSDIRASLTAIRRVCPDPQPLTLVVHSVGIRLAERYQFKLFDAMIVAAALAAGCDVLWSEDMHDGLVVDGRLTIRNSFA